MAAGQSSPRREGLSVTTLVIAAIASAVAAIVTSTFWRGGTIVTAAMSPVIIAIVKELLARPIQSDVVRKPLKAATGSVGTVTNRRFDHQHERERGVRVGARSGPSSSGLPSRRPDRAEDVAAPTPGDRVLGTTPMRTYGTSRRKLRIGVAVATGLVAFAIAFVVLTVPELVFGGSIAGGGRTTLVPGGSSKATTKTSTSTSPGSSSGSGSQTSTTTTQQATPPSGSQTSTTTSPLQSPPSQSTPPSNAAPRSGGSSGSQAPPSSGGSSGSGGSSPGG